MAFTPATPQEQVEALYIGYFGRAGEPGGVQYWVDQIQAGRTFAQVAAAFAVQAEAKATHPFLAAPDLVSPGAFVDSLYTNLLERTADASGRAYWVAQATAAQGNPFALGLLVAQFISGAQGDDIVTLQNKIDAAEDFTSSLAAAGIIGTDANGQVLPDVDAAGTEIIGNVTKDPASVTAAAAATDSFVSGGGGAGETATFVLTVGDDFADQTSAFRNNGDIESDFKFTAGNQTVTASTFTATAGDVLSDNSTTDSDNFNLSASGDDAFDGAEDVVLSNIENINISMSKVDDFFDFSNITGAKTVTLTGSVDLFAEINGFADSGVTTFNFQNVTGDIADGANVTISDNAADEDMTFNGGAGVDEYITVGEGNNTFNMAGGYNSVDATDGDNKYTGGSGADEVDFGDGDNVVALGDGINEFDAGDGDNTVTSGSGVDNIDVGNGDNTITTGGAADVIVVGTGDNTITAGAGADSVTLGGGANLINIAVADTGNSLATADVLTNFLSGSDQIDFLTLAAAEAGVNYSEVAVGADPDASAANFTAAQTAANAAFAAGNGDLLYVVATNATGSVIFVDTDFNGEANISVVLAGISAAGIAAEDII